MALPKPPRTTKPQQINLRVTEFQSRLLDQAAQTQGKNRTEFILGAAIREAQQTLDVQRNLFIDEVTFAAFEEALEAPVRSTGELKALFASRAPWE